MNAPLKTLVVDCNMDLEFWGAAPIRRELSAFKGIEVVTRRAPAGDLPLNLDGFHGVVVSGSRTSCFSRDAWVLTLEKRIQEALDRKLPFFGICFGHQMLCRVLSGPEILGHSSHPEYGWITIEKLKTDSEWLKGLPNKFQTYSSHFEEVKTAPAGFKITASSPMARVQAIEAEDGRAIFSTQFHPEADPETVLPTLKKKLKTEPKLHLYHPLKGDSLYDPKIGRTLFAEFVKRVTDAANSG